MAQKKKRLKIKENLMKKLVVLVVLVMAISLTFGNAFAAVFPHEEAKVEITIPDTWKVEPKGDELHAEVKGETAADDLILIFSIVKGEDLVATIESSTKELEKQFGELKTEKTTEIELNGMKTYCEDCKSADGKYSVSLAMIQTPANKFMLVYYAASPEAEKKYEKDVTDILQSIKPLADEKKAEEKK